MQKLFALLTISLCPVVLTAQTQAIDLTPEESVIVEAIKARNRLEAPAEMPLPVPPAPPAEPMQAPAHHETTA